MEKRLHRFNHREARPQAERRSEYRRLFRMVLALEGNDGVHWKKSNDAFDRYLRSKESGE